MYNVKGGENVKKQLMVLMLAFVVAVGISGLAAADNMNPDNQGSVSLLNPAQNQTQSQASSQAQTLNNSNCNNVANSNTNTVTSTSCATNNNCVKNVNIYKPVNVVKNKNKIGDITVTSANLNSQTQTSRFI